MLKMHGSSAIISDEKHQIVETIIRAKCHKNGAHDNQ
jgi:hypothetical protein